MALFQSFDTNQAQDRKHRSQSVKNGGTGYVKQIISLLRHVPLRYIDHEYVTSSMIMKLSTQTKLSIARCLLAVATVWRKLTGDSSPTVVCKRRGVKWNLDLNQGIDLAIYIFGAFERDTAKALLRLAKPGMVVLDIGANIGAHTLPLAAHIGKEGRLIAIEPSDWAYEKLLTNLGLNPELQTIVTPVQAALIGTTGLQPSEFYASWDLNTVTGSHPIHGGQLRSSSGAKYVTLDNLVSDLSLPSVDLIKLDVDGFECEVLRGARKTLQQYTPPIVMELCPDIHEEVLSSSFDELVTLLDTLGYSYADEVRFRPLPSNCDALRALIPEGGGINVIAIPKGMTLP